MAGRKKDDEGGIEQSDGVEGEGLGGEESSDGDSDVGTEGEDEEELLRNEDAIQTAARLLGKRDKKDTETEESSEEESVPDEEEDGADESASDDDDDDEGVEEEEEEIEPPIRLTADAKKAFKSWPTKAKQEFVSAVKNLESTFNRSNQELVNAKKEAEHIVQAVRPYYSSKPELAAKGISEAQVITGLIGNHQLLTHDDENVRRQKFLAIGQSIGLVDENGQLVDGDSGESGGQINQNVINQAVKTALQTEIAPIKSFVESQQQVQIREQQEQVVADIQAVMNETDALGNYVYPELHDSDYHTQQVQPLVAGLVRSIPNLSYGDATKLAVQRLRLQNGKSSLPNPARLPTNNEDHKERAAKAGVSARGKTVASSGVEKLTPLQQSVMELYPIGGR